MEYGTFLLLGRYQGLRTASSKGLSSESTDKEIITFISENSRRCCVHHVLGKFNEVYNVNVFNTPHIIQNIYTPYCCFITVIIVILIILISLKSLLINIVAGVT